MVFMPLKTFNIDIPKISVAEWLLQHFRESAAEGKKALVWADEGTEISCEDLLRDGVRVATALRMMGAKSGDTMAVVALNAPELFVFVLGGIFADITISGNTFELSAEELRDNFETSLPRYILTPPEKVAAIQKAISGMSPQPEIILLDEKTLREFTRKGAHADPDTFETAPVDNPHTHIFLYSFTSGTTGKQKAAMINDYGFLTTFLLATAPASNKREGLIVCASQNAWMTWYIVFLRCAQGTPWLFTTAKDTDSYMDFIHKYKPTWSKCAPFQAYEMSKAIERHPGRWDISSIRLIEVSGDRMSTDLHRQVSEKLKTNVYQVYRATELGVITYTDDHQKPVYGSSGKLCVPIKLVNPETEEKVTETNTVGEIRCRALLMSGYLGNHKATADAFDKDGWFKTGDLAHIDEKDNVFIVNRIKDMLRYRGFTVAPAELEEILRQIPGISDAVVVGKNDETVGSILTAFVVKKPGSHVTEQDILNFMTEKNLHDAKKLRGGVIFINRLPINGNGKILRRKLTDILNNTAEVVL